MKADSSSSEAQTRRQWRSLPSGHGAARSHSVPAPLPPFTASLFVAMTEVATVTATPISIATAISTLHQYPLHPLPARFHVPAPHPSRPPPPPSPHPHPTPHRASHHPLFLTGMCTATLVRYGCTHTRLSHWRSCRPFDARPSPRCPYRVEEWVARAQECGECVYRRWVGEGRG